MHSLIIVLIILAIILIVFVFLFLFYLVYLSLKTSKLIDKIEFVVDDIIIKLENLNPSIDSLKKLFNYIDAFDMIFKNNLKAGLSLLRRNSFVLFKLLKIFQDLLIKKESKKTIFSEIFKRREKKASRNNQKKVKPKKAHPVSKLLKNRKIFSSGQREQFKRMDLTSAGGFIGNIIDAVRGQIGKPTKKNVRSKKQKTKEVVKEVVKKK